MQKLIALSLIVHIFLLFHTGGEYSKGNEYDRNNFHVKEEYLNVPLI